MLIRCTTKVLKEIGITKSALVEVLESDNPLDEWCVNLFYFNRQKCLIFTNAASLFSFIVHGIYRKEIRGIEELFLKELPRALYYENFSADQIKFVINQFRHIELARTINRSVLASMNGLVARYLCFKSYATRSGEIDDTEMQCQLNKMPMRICEYKLPIDNFKDILNGKKVKKIAQNKNMVYIFDAKMVQYSEGKNIVREVAVTSDKSLLDLAKTILNSFNFQCDHCFGFYGDINKHPGKEQTEVYESFVDAGVERTVECAKGVERTKIASVFKDIGKKMLFMFDYGDDWQFTVELKEIREKLGNEPLPKVLSSVGEAPLQYPPLNV